MLAPLLSLWDIIDYMIDTTMTVHEFIQKFQALLMQFFINLDTGRYSHPIFPVGCSYLIVHKK